MNKRALFLRHVGQTSDIPLSIPIEKAEGVRIYTTDGRVFLDFNSGISVSSLGHGHPKIISAIKHQADLYLHTMVYGEHIQQPQVDYALALTSMLTKDLNALYYLNCGTEAIELVIKMARKYTGRSRILSCANAYHGSTYGAESLRSDLDFTRNFGPGLPDVHHIPFNDFSALSKIDRRTAAIICEPVQAEAGIIPPDTDYLHAIRSRCNETGTLMVLDEIQTGFGRTGYLFAHQKYKVIPDVVLIAKAMGGGMPIGGVLASKQLFDNLATNPMLGHITTFGGHPVCVAAAIASLNILVQEGVISTVLEKEKLFRSLLVHPLIKQVRSSGLMLAVDIGDEALLPQIIEKIVEAGVFVDFFLFNKTSFRIAPPLVISESDIKEGVALIINVLDGFLNHGQ